MFCVADSTVPRTVKFAEDDMEELAVLVAVMVMGFEVGTVVGAV
jgi:hypothetical protein